MPQYRISEVASLLGVSDDTVRRWVDQGSVEAEHDDAGRLVIDGVAAARRAVDVAEVVEDPSGIGRSARNRFVGLVTRVQRDGIMAQVDIQSGPHRIVSLMSAEAVDELALEVGSLAVAVVKATTVIVETPGGTR